MSTSCDVLLICVCLLTHSVLSCDYDSAEKRAHCNSANLLEDVSYHPEWLRLNVDKRRTQEYTTLKKDRFKNIPNLTDLQIKGTINGIEKGAFNGLDKLFELRLHNNTLETIKSHTFGNLSIEVLNIYFCEVENIEPKAFEGLNNLKMVNIYGNQIASILAGVFSGLNIEKIILRNNGIEDVEDNAFGDMDHLKWLSLEENKLTAFEPQLTIGYSSSITNLYINRNKITEIERGMLSVLPNLQVLLLNINSIKRFGDYAFNDLKQLRLLDISNNRLEELQNNVFNSKGMQSLELLFIHDNKMSFLSTGTLARLPNLQQMSVGGNPWQCPCWNLLDRYIANHNISRLCYEMYVQGDRPFCVFSDIHVKDCIFDLESVTDIPHIYADNIKKYPALPKVCNVDGVNKPVLME